MKHSLYPLLGLFALGVSANANAQGDVTAILENLQAPVNNLTAGLQEGSSGFANTAAPLSPGPAALNALSAPSLGSVPLEGVVDSVASQYGRLLESILNNPDALLDELPQNELDLPFISPATAPEDLNTIAGNLANVSEAAIEGMRFLDFQFTPIADKSGFRDAAIELLRGNLVEPPTGFREPLGPSAVNSTLLGLASATEALLADSSYDGEYASGPSFVFLPQGHASDIILQVAFIANGSDFEPFPIAPLPLLVPAEEALVPFFESAEPLTLPLIQQIEDF